MEQNISSTDYRFSPGQWFVGGQMTFVAFGALVLVPLLTGLDPNVALFTAGAGTLVFQLVTKGKVPVFLASSFAFIAPIIYGVQTWGIAGTMSGIVAAGLVYVAISFMVRILGADFLHRILPRVVTGPVIMVIGLILAPVAVNMAMGKSGDGAIELVPLHTALILSGVSLAVTVAVMLYSKGIFRVIPILFGVIAGYVLALVLGDLVSFDNVAAASWIGLPSFVFPEWNWMAVLYMIPIAIAPAIEHFGDVMAIGGVTKKDYLKDPGVEKTMLGDGLATGLAGLLGGPPNTTYSEVTGAVMITRAFNPAVMTWAALFAILLSFCGKLGALLQTIPVPVMGGILLLLFGTITVVGLTTLLKEKQDILLAPRNIVVISMILVSGIGGAVLSVGSFALGGIGLAGLVGLVLNLVLPKAESADG